MPNNSEINIRDPYVLVHDGRYYLYGTRGATCWTAADGFDCYTGTDLINWEGPYEVFHKPEGFWANENYWAPEVHKYKDAFYMFATFSDVTESGRVRGTQILKAESPLGPFMPHSDGPVTPSEWACLDGTFYVSPKGTPYMIFCHEWTQVGDGTICSIELSEDLCMAVSKPVKLFSASEATEWVRKLERRDNNRDNYVTDGPFVFRSLDGKLHMLWSSFGAEGYVEAMAGSENGDIEGPWRQEKPLFMKDGGHGMLFCDMEGRTKLCLHSPNASLKERPVFIDLSEIQL